MSNWVASYEKRGVESHCHVITIDGSELTLHRHIDYGADRWLFTCYDIGLSRVLLMSRDVEQAKTECLKAVKAHLMEKLRALKLISGKGT